MAWTESISRRLADRDLRERDGFAEIIETNNRLQSQADTLLDRNMELEDTVARLKQQLHESQSRTHLSAPTGILTASPVTSNPPVTPVTSMMSGTGEDNSAVISALKEESRELYKLQAASAQRLVSATEELVAKREELARKEEAILMLTNQLRHANQRNQDLKMSVSEKDSAIQLLQDELSALQLELGKIEERCRQSEEDNRVLTERWLRKMNEEADKMNQANQFYESMMERRQQSLSPVASDLEKTMLLTQVVGGSEADDTSLEQVIREDVRIRAGLKPSKLPSACRLELLKANLNGDDKVCSICFSPDGLLLAAGGSDRNLRIFNSQDGSPKASLSGCLQAIMCTQISQQTGSILAASNDNSIRVWNLQTGRSRYTLTGHIGQVWSARFAIDNRHIISGSHDRTIKVWDLQRGRCIRTIFAYSSVYDLTLTDDAGVISGHADNCVRYWDAKTGDCIKEISGIHAGSISSISISPDAFQILTSSRDNTLKIIDIRTFKVFQTFSDPSFKIPFDYSRACYSSDGRLIAAGSSDGKVFVWNSASGQLEKQFDCESERISAVAWSPQGQGCMAVGGQIIHLYQ